MSEGKKLLETLELPRESRRGRTLRRKGEHQSVDHLIYPGGGGRVEGDPRTLRTSLGVGWKLLSEKCRRDWVGERRLGEGARGGCGLEIF